MEYTNEMKEVNECLDSWLKKGMDGIIATHAILEYAQWIDKVDFEQAKELMYRFVAHTLHPEWNE